MSECAFGDVERLKSGGPAMTVVGRVRLRSSSPSFQDGDAPGESKIHELNPRRQEKILEKMVCWRRLEPGSLNLCLDREEDRNKVRKLTDVKELIFEPYDEINYPNEWQHIPKIRRGYKYYLATATVKGETEEVLVRRAINPLPGRIELFAAVNLRGLSGFPNAILGPFGVFRG